MGAERPRLVLLTADTVGGVWTYAVELARALGTFGVHTAIATMGAPLSAAQRGEIGAVHTASVYESGYRLEWMSEPWDDVARCGAWLLRLERELHPDVVHLNQYAFGSLPFRTPKLVVGHSCVLSWWRAVHRADAPPSWRRYAEVVARGLAGADIVAAPTHAMLDALRTHYPGFVRAHVIPNGRTATAFSPQAKAPFVLAAGRLWDEAKNIGALEAIAFDIDWPIFIAGPQTGPDGVTRSTRCLRALGELAPAELASQLGRAAIYALPARYEPFGLSTLEAGLSGCALVLGDIASLREVWGDAAMFVRPDDHAGLAATLERLIADPQLVAAMGAKSRARALEHAPTRTAELYLEAYARAANVRAMPLQEAACAS